MPLHCLSTARRFPIFFSATCQDIHTNICVVNTNSFSKVVFSQCATLVIYASECERPLCSNLEQLWQTFIMIIVSFMDVPFNITKEREWLGNGNFFRVWRGPVKCLKGEGGFENQLMSKIYAYPH